MQGLECSSSFSGCKTGRLGTSCFPVASSVLSTADIPLMFSSFFGPKAVDFTEALPLEFCFVSSGNGYLPEM